MSMIHIDKPGACTIAAALFFYDFRGMGNPAFRSDEVHDIATDGGNLAASLDDEGIKPLRLEIEREVAASDTDVVSFEVDLAQFCTMRAAIEVYDQHEMGDPANRTDAVHAIATGGNNSVISLDSDGVASLVDLMREWDLDFRAAPSP